MIISDTEGCPKKFVNKFTQTSGQIMCDKTFYKELIKKLESNKNLNIVFCGDYFDNGSLKNIITIGGIEQKNLNLYIGNTYIFNQSNNNLNQQIIISKKKLEYNTLFIN